MSNSSGLIPILCVIGSALLGSIIGYAISDEMTERRQAQQTVIDDMNQRMIVLEARVAQLESQPVDFAAPESNLNFNGEFSSWHPRLWKISAYNAGSGLVELWANRLPRLPCPTILNRSNPIPINAALAGKPTVAYSLPVAQTVSSANATDLSIRRF